MSSVLMEWELGASPHRNSVSLLGPGAPSVQPEGRQGEKDKGSPRHWSNNTYLCGAGDLLLNTCTPLWELEALQSVEEQAQYSSLPILCLKFTIKVEVSLICQERIKWSLRLPKHSETLWEEKCYVNRSWFLQVINRCICKSNVKTTKERSFWIKLP